MADVTSGITIIDAGTDGGIRRWIVTTAATADAGDTLTFELDDHGITDLLYVHGFSHTTTGSVVVEEAPTTAVSGARRIPVRRTNIHQRQTHAHCKWQPTHHLTRYEICVHGSVARFDIPRVRSDE